MSVAVMAIAKTMEVLILFARRPPEWFLGFSRHFTKMSTLAHANTTVLNKHSNHTIFERITNVFSVFMYDTVMLLVYPYNMMMIYLYCDKRLIVVMDMGSLIPAAISSWSMVVRSLPR